MGSLHEPQGGHSLRPVSQEGVCRSTLLGPAFAPCHGLVDAGVYVAACTRDLCRCPTCPCATFAEYSRQCAHAGGQPQNWRGPDLCRECPGEVAPGTTPGPWLGTPGSERKAGEQGVVQGLGIWAPEGGRGTLSRAPPEPRWGLEAVPRSWAPCSPPLPPHPEGS